MRHMYPAAAELQVAREPDPAANGVARLERDVEFLRDRISWLCAASRRINASLDLDTVLQEVVDSACTLIGAKTGGITILDDDGQSHAFCTSALTQEEHQWLLDLSGDPAFRQYLTQLSAPMRVADFSAHTEAVGLPEIASPVGSVVAFMGVPIRHPNRHVGYLYLIEKKDGRAFVREEEETLDMFDPQAAVAIANARRYRSEQQAKTDLELLIDASPAGALVFDTVKMDLVWFNKETRRIVGGMHGAGSGVAPPTVSSSHSHQPSWWRESGQRCASRQRPSELRRSPPICWRAWRSTTRIAA